LKVEISMSFCSGPTDPNQTDRQTDRQGQTASLWDTASKGGPHNN